MSRMLPAVLLLIFITVTLGAAEPPQIDASSLRGKILCGYQGWFRCPGDASNSGWVHWSRDSKRITKDTLTFEMWPDLSDFPPAERCDAPGFTYPDGRPAQLFSSDNAATVLRHFEWMRQYGLDGVWLQHFLVDFPNGRSRNSYDSRLRVLDHVRAAAKKTGRVWALTYDISGMPAERIFEALTTDWKKQVDEHVIADDRYLHEAGKPVVEVWGFYHTKSGNMTAALASRLIEFFHTPGPCAAFLVAGGDWNWRANSDPEWQALFPRFDAYSPWNTGNTAKDNAGVVRASTRCWADDKVACEKNGQLWLPVVYPGFSWDNLQRKPSGSSLISRRKGAFLWEQFHTLSQLKVNSVCVAMFDEVDEGTAIFKVSNTPPTQAHFVTFEDMPSDWYLRLVGEATQRFHSATAIPVAIPLKP